MSLLENMYEAIRATGLIELIAVLTGVIYVILAALRSNWCWIFAIVSSGLFVFLCLEVQLYMESILQLFYVIMGIVGWYSWSSQTKKIADEKTLLDQQNGTLEITRWPLKNHLINIGLTGSIALLLGYIFDQFTAQQNPYVDAFITIFSLVTTILLIRKVLENWIYWAVIDIVSIYLYYERGYSLSAVLYFLFAIVAVLGFLAWNKKFKSQSA